MITCHKCALPMQEGEQGKTIQQHRECPPDYVARAFKEVPSVLLYILHGFLYGAENTRDSVEKLTFLCALKKAWPNEFDLVSSGYCEVGLEGISMQ